MRTIIKENIKPITVVPGDSIILKTDITATFPDGHEELMESKTVLESEIEKSYTFTEAVIFEVEEGEFGDDVVGGLGGAFLETKSGMPANTVQSVSSGIGKKSNGKLRIGNIQQAIKQLPKEEMFYVEALNKKYHAKNTIL